MELDTGAHTKGAMDTYEVTGRVELQSSALASSWSLNRRALMKEPKRARSRELVLDSAVCLRDLEPPGKALYSS